MADMKNRIMKKDLDDDFIISNFQVDSEIITKENKLPDLITLTSEKQEQMLKRKQNENITHKPREAAMMLNKMHNKKNNKMKIEDSWRVMMGKLLKNKVITIIVMMLIVLVGNNCKVSAATVHELMSRDNVDYMIGAYTANKNTNYKAELVTKVIFASEVPDGATSHWDVSANKDGSVMSHIVPSVLNSDSVQCYDQYIVSSEPINATNCFQLFRGYSNMTEIKNIGYMTTVDVTSMKGMFYGCTALTSLTLTNFNTSAVRNMSNMFTNASSLVELDLSSFVTTNVNDMSYMFDSCSSLTLLNINNFNTINVTNMERMFDNCSKLTNLNVSSFNTSNVTNMASMFYACSSLTTLNLSNFNTANVTNMSKMFTECSALTTLNLSSFVTTNVTDMSKMFDTCSALSTLDVSKFDTTNVTDMNRMFDKCLLVTKLDVSNFNTSKVTNMESMFYDCSRITTLDLSSFDTTNVTNVNKLLRSSQRLEILVLGPNFTKLDGTEMFSGATGLKRIISNRKITTSSELMAFSASTGLKNLKSAILYVPSEEIETLYQTNSVYAEQLGNARIEPMLALVGDNPQVIDMGGAYTELGFNIAGETLSNLETKGIGDYKVTINTDAINNSIMDTYDVVYTLEYKNPTDTNGTYTTYMSTTRKVEVGLIGPKVESFVVRNLETGVYAANTALEIVATMTEEFSTTKGRIPEVSIAFGNGTAVKLSEGIVNGRNILYTYTIGISDFGKLECVDFNGELYDSLDTRMVFEGPMEFTDKEIYARSGVILESDLESNKYFPTLKDAAHYITTSATLTMLLDEEATESAVFKANTVVSLNINGKKVLLNTNDKSTNTLISNKGILNITDSGAGTLGVVSTSGDAYIIANEGIISIVKGSVRVQGSKNGTVYGVYNSGDLLITGGNVDATNPEGKSYGVYNLGTLIIEGGTVASATIKGTTVGVYNLNGSVNLLGGQIASRITEGNSGLATAVYNVSGPFIVGTDDGSISIEKPVIYSTKDGLRNTSEGTLEFYDGVIEGEVYRALYTDKVKTVEGYALVRKLVGERERVYMAIDISEPIIELTNMTPNWTNGKVTIQVKFIDQESGIKNAMYKNTELQLVNNMVMIDVSENGTYTFKAVDFAGNSSEASIKISNIDKEKPTFENLSYTSLASENEVKLTVTLKDNSSGVKAYKLSKYEVEPSTWEKLDNILTETTLDISLSTNGKYYLYAVDQAGNIGKYNSVVEISGIDISPPTITHLEIDNNGKDFANSSVVMIDVEAKDDIGVEKILLSNTMLTNNEVINSKNWVPYTKEILWTFPIGDGEKIVYVWVKDAVGKISKASSRTTKLLAQYIGNDGTNSTTFKILSTDENYNYLKELTASDLYIRVKNISGAETYRSGYGEGITIGATPEVYGPVQEGSTVRKGRYYFIKADNIQGNGTIFLGLKNTAEVDKAQNQANKLEIETDVTVELSKPIISITDTAITVTDADRHVMDAIRVGGKTVRLSNGSISKSELESKYNISLTSGTVIEAIDKCGNLASAVWGN